MISATSCIGGLVVVWFVIPYALRKTFFKPAFCKSERKLNGKKVLITGANAGLGKITTADLAKRGATVYMACRNMEKAEQAKQDILSANPEAKLKLIKLDLNSLKSVKECADKFLQDNDTLDILVANAGFGALQHKLTEDDIEWHLGCNHLGHFYLTRLLMPCMQKAGTPSSKSRIVVVSSRSHKRVSDSIDYERLQAGKVSFAYAHSKLANILFSRYLSKIIAGSNVTVNSLHPGIVSTNFFYNFTPYINFNLIMLPLKHIFLSELEGAQTQIWAAVDETLEGVSGKYFRDCGEATPSQGAQNDEEAEKLWRWSCSKTRLPLDL